MSQKGTIDPRCDLTEWTENYKLKLMLLISFD